MVSNKQDDLRKIDIILKIYRQIKQRASFRKRSKNFKIIDGHLAYKGKRRVMFDNDSESLRPQYHCFNVIQNSFTALKLLMGI